MKKLFSSILLALTFASPAFADAASDIEYAKSVRIQSRLQIGAALLAVKGLETTLLSGFGHDPFFLAIHQPTISAINTWLKTDAVNDSFTVSRVRQFLESNLAQTEIWYRGAPNQGICPSSYAYTYVSRPDLGITLCDLFFHNAGPQCQRDALTHEIFHHVGLNHGNDKPRDQMTTADALDSADNLSQLVAQIATGKTDACPKGL